MELEETRENPATNLQSLLENLYAKFKYQDQVEECARRLLRKRRLNGKPKYRWKSKDMEVEFSEFGEVPMEVDRRVWRKVRRRIGDPTKEGLSRGGGSSSPPLSGQPTGHVVQ